MQLQTYLKNTNVLPGFDVTTILDKRKKVKYIRKILKFIVTVMTLAAAAIISIRTFYSSTPTTVDSSSAAMTTKKSEFHSH